MDRLENQDLLTLAFEHAADGMAVFDEAHRLQVWNRPFQDLSGLLAAQLCRGAPLPPGDLSADFEACRDSGSAGLVRERQLPDGRCVQARCSRLPGGCAMLVLTDVTAGKAAEARRAEQQRMLHVLVDRTEQGIWFVDNQGRTTGANPAMCRMLGLTLPQLLGQPIDAVMAAEEGRVLRNRLVRDSQGAAVSHEGMLRRADGTVLEIQAHGAADGSRVLAFTDITAHEAAKGRLEESESRFRAMANAAPAFIWLSDADGHPLWFNERWLGATGRDLDTELAQHWSARIHADDLESCRAAFAGAVRLRRAYVIEFRVRCADGQLLWIADHGIPRVAPDGTVDGFISYGWDLTERKAAEAALIAAKDEAERANRAKSDFLSRMSHELRTPLNAVLGFGQLLESDRVEPLGPLQRSRVQELLRGGRHLLSLINDVLDLARIEAGALRLELAPVDLAALVQECMPLVQPAAAAGGVALSVRNDVAGPVSVRADRTRLKQVLLNLLSNAVKYNRSGGHVDVCWQQQGEAVRIEVRDTGPGLDPQQQERLFHIFERLDAGRTDVEGAGIGLALSKWLVDLMQGSIGVDSAPGLGSTFWVELSCALPGDATARAEPQHMAEAKGRPPGGPQAAPAAVRQRTVLYIEDNEVNQLLMQGVMAQRPGLRLVVAEHPEKGLGLAWTEEPDLVLLDIQLPGMDGFEVLRRLRADPRTCGVPVLAVSANAMPADRARAAQAGFVDYVTKPIDLPLLLALLDRLLPG